MKKWIGGVIVFVILANAGFGVYLEPLLYTLTPLRRYYLAPYLLSSMKAGDASATTKVRWLWKVRPEIGSAPKHGGRKASQTFQYELALEDDVVPVPARQRLWKNEVLPFTMSRKAEGDGWSGVVWHNPMEMNSAQLATGLRTNFFDGDPAWRFFVQPLVLILLVLLLLWIATRERAAYYRKNPWSSTPFWQHLTRQTLEGGRQFRKRLKVRRASPALPPPMSVRLIEAAPAKRLPVPAEALSKPLPQPDAVPPEPSKSPVQPALWDESKGLE